MKDPGWFYFRDYYKQLRSEKEAKSFLRPGRIVSGAGIGGIRWIVIEVNEVGFIVALLENGPPVVSKTIQFEHVVFPGNILYALEFDEDSESKALDAVKAHLKKLKGQTS